MQLVRQVRMLLIGTMRRKWCRMSRRLIGVLPVFLCACYSVDSQGRRIAVRDGLPQDGAKGFAEFRLSLDSDVKSVTVRRVGDRKLFGAALVQINGGESALLRIAAPPGLQQFLVATQKRISVPISEG